MMHRFNLALALLVTLTQLAVACGSEEKDICDSARDAVENCDGRFGVTEEQACKKARDACSKDDQERAAKTLACLSGKECTTASLITCSAELEGISSECQQAVMALIPN